MDLATSKLFNDGDCVDPNPRLVCPQTLVDTEPGTVYGVANIDFSLLTTRCEGGLYEGELVSPRLHGNEGGSTGTSDSRVLQPRPHGASPHQIPCEDGASRQDACEAINGCMFFKGGATVGRGLTAEIVADMDVDVVTAALRRSGGMLPWRQWSAFQVNVPWLTSAPRTSGMFTT